MEGQNHLNRIIPIRFRQAEYEYLKQKSLEPDITGRVNDNFSAFIRETLLCANHYNDSVIRRQIADLRYEIHKIGVNINQATKKINAGYGTLNDIKELKSDLDKVEKKFAEYEKLLEQVWLSQN